MLPTVSVIIPTHNRRPLVWRAAMSVLKQEHRPQQLIIVDDASTDDTGALVPRLEAESARLTGGQTEILYHRQPQNRGANAARNIGFRMASSSHIAFLDSDDLWHPTKLARQVEAIAGHSGDVLVYTGRLRVNQKLDLICRQYHPPITDSKDMVRANTVGTLSSVMMPRDVLIRLGGFDESLQAGQDRELYLRAFQHLALVGIPEPLTLYDDAPIDRTTRAPMKMLKAHLAIYKRHQRGRIAPPDKAMLYLLFAEDFSLLGRGKLARRFTAAYLRLALPLGPLAGPVAHVVWPHIQKLRYLDYAVSRMISHLDRARRHEDRVYLEDYRRLIRSMPA